MSVYALGCYLAGESFRNAKTNAGVASVYPADLAKLFGVSGQTMRTWLRTLEHDGWIEIGEVVERSRAPWAIRLAALASVNTSAKQTPPKNFAQPLQSTSNPTAKQPDIDAHASAGPERASAASPLQSDLPSLTRARDEKKREEKSSSRGVQRSRATALESCRTSPTCSRTPAVARCVEVTARGTCPSARHRQAASGLAARAAVAWGGRRGAQGTRRPGAGAAVAGVVGRGACST